METMTQEENKGLLLKDLCARLPYGVKVNNEIQGDFEIYGFCENFVFGRNEVCHIDFDVEKIKPYLFPLSSMTEEQIKEFNSITLKCNAYTGKSILLTDFCNKHHIDWRGFIEKGFAIDATGLNIY